MPKMTSFSGENQNENHKSIFTNKNVETFYRECHRLTHVFSMNVGDNVGCNVGSSIGDSVGWEVGDSVGSFDGDGVGSYVGAGVGSYVSDGIGSVVVGSVVVVDGVGLTVANVG